MRFIIVEPPDQASHAEAEAFVKGSLSLLNSFMLAGIAQIESMRGVQPKKMIGGVGDGQYDTNCDKPNGAYPYFLHKVFQVQA